MNQFWNQKTKHTSHLEEFSISKKIVPIAFILFLVSGIIQGQNFSQEFGKIGRDEIDLETYGHNGDAEAVVLFDKAQSYFTDKGDFVFEVVFERTTRIKILSEAGIRWGEVEIPFYQENNIYEQVTDIEAVSYNFENGNLSKSSLSLRNTYDEKINNYWNNKKFAIPNVKVGSIIEYRYKISSQYLFNFRNWTFQWKIPVIYSEYQTRMIPFYEYQFMLQGAEKFDIYEAYEDKGIARNLGKSQAYGTSTYHDMVYKFAMKNLPAFDNEAFIASMKDYVIRLDFQLAKIHHPDGTKTEVIPTWPYFIKELLRHPDFGSFVSKSKNLTSTLFDLKALIQLTESERFNTVIDYVKANFSWNGQSDQFATKTPGKLVTDKVGNSADINLLAVGLLKGLKIESYPLILSTREHGKINSSYPFNHFFNEVIICSIVDGEMILSDATEIASMNNRIPLRCINDKGLIIKKDKVDWIDLNCQFSSDLNCYLKINVDENLVSVDLMKRATEYDALSFRNNYGDKAEQVVQKISHSDYTIDASSLQIQNYQDRTKPFILRYRFTVKPEILNDKIYLAPFLQEVLSDNPLKQAERRYSTDLIYPQKRVYSSQITIPEGYKVDVIPDDLTIDNDLFELNYVVQNFSNKLLINFNYYFKTSIYPAAEYSNLRNYFNEIVKKGNEKIVLVKQTNTSNEPF